MRASSPTRSAKLPLSFAFRDHPASLLAGRSPAPLQRPGFSRLRPVQAIPLLLSAIAFIVLSDYLIHGVFLKPYYQEADHLWREPQDCLFPLMILGQVFVAFALTLVVKQCLSLRAGLREAAGFVLSLGLIAAGRTLMVYALQTLPSIYYTKWLAAGAVQAILLAALIYGFSASANPSSALKRH